MSTSNNTFSLIRILKLLGPGLLFAGAAVGVSHLVLSTQIGATYGYGLLWAILIANVIKYPFFEFSPRYTAAMGETILDGYFKLGSWVLWIFLGMTLVSMIAIQSAVTVVTASIASKFIPLGKYSIPLWSAVFLLIGGFILYVGKYGLFDKVMKGVIIVLTITSIISVILAFGKKSPNLEWAQIFPTDDAGLILVIMLFGWMPAPIDLSVWSSLWSFEKSKEDQEHKTVKASILDFNIGYVGTMILALCFLLMGAYVMYDSGEVFSSKGSEFTSQLIDMYGRTLGDWAAPMIGIATLATMFSTSFTCQDALPRSMAYSTQLLAQNKKLENRWYWIWMIILILGTLFVLVFMVTEMKTMITVATVLSFLTAPFFALLNFILVTKSDFPSAHKPPKWLKILSIIGLIGLVSFALYYLKTQWF